MVESLWITLSVATILGLLSGLGTGGGSLLILWLTMVLGMEQHTARAINLLFFLPAALVATILRWRRGGIDLKKLAPAILSGCLAAAAGAWLGSVMELTLLKKLFGGLLLLTGIRELCYKRKDQPGKP